MVRLSIILLIIALLTACSSDKTETSTGTSEPAQQTTSEGQSAAPTLERATLTEHDMKIQYPQITNLGDAKLEKTINSLIRNEARKAISYYAANETTMDIDYAVKRMDDKILSIQYTGYANSKGAAHPNNLYFTTNVDLTTGMKMLLKDTVKLDDSFVKLLRSAKYVPFDPSLDLSKEAADELSNWSDAELLTYMKQADDIGIGNVLNVFTYRTADALGISLSVPHALGDHVEFEISNADLAGKFTGAVQ
ncbi:hypothetical protein PCCS19_16130 [Paenibacillus sp. CCS19]|uniref:DUF4163 domain-containing protein n=1 Tax=Paenibacillus sp. CCS19 TaxID=3158387 RepID=UPI00256C1DE2|nr:DUF4163 domain-containing protein [Paenibacillus cellulosilyticus]GMK38559.1 hypothetical protein PCCS19_16130 [Paenibacillus cellulosilyticus]